MFSRILLRSWDNINNWSNISNSFTMSSWILQWSRSIFMHNMRRSCLLSSCNALHRRDNRHNPSSSSRGGHHQQMGLSKQRKQMSARILLSKRNLHKLSTRTFLSKRHIPATPMPSTTIPNLFIYLLNSLALIMM
jgi:hypothetical protein